jgi:hypothetical protein
LSIDAKNAHTAIFASRQDISPIDRGTIVLLQLGGRAIDVFEGLDIVRDLGRAGPEIPDRDLVLRKRRAVVTVEEERHG